MPTLRKAQLIAVFLSSAAVVACSEQQTLEPPENPRYGIEALSGCYDPTDPQCSNIPPSGDPAPGDSGVYLGTSYTPETCTSFYIGDADEDGFDDMCEFQLALAFRPLLSADPLDENLTRQSYWAAKWGGGYVEIAYLIGYYFDNGNTHSAACEGVGSIYCWGHFGDSEFIILRAYYDYTTKHWKMAQATLSAHYEATGIFCPFIECDYTANRSATDFEFPTKRLHYPRVYVALNKHANYYSRAACNSGGALNSDDCTYAADYARVSVNRYHNVGSGRHPRITNVTSTVNPVLYYGTEYMWNDENYTRFCGWDGPSGSNRANCSTSYEEILYDFAFGIAL